jgi:hydroxymethylpyrimidine/phosphomethylpyrimidine kinase
MVAKGGQPLLEEEAINTLKYRLLPLATIVTPNLPEAEVLRGNRIGSREDMAEAAGRMLTLGCKAVLLKGGHLPGDIIYDVLATAEGQEIFESARIATRNTHGTGCSLASAIATGLAQGLALRDAVLRARAYVRAAILSAPNLGHGHGPLDHAHTVRPFTGE